MLLVLICVTIGMMRHILVRIVIKITFWIHIAIPINATRPGGVWRKRRWLREIRAFIFMLH